MDRVPVYVHADDPISRLGVGAALRHRPELRMLEGDEQQQARVALVVIEALDDSALPLLRQLHRQGSTRLVLVVATVDEAALPGAVECGVVGLMFRNQATADRLTQAISSADRGEGSMPADLLGGLLEQLARLQRQILDPRGLSSGGLSNRETEILRLVAEGHDTGEIARTLSYSERTVKGVLHDVTTRLHLRNRSHAVAYAMRHGFI
jgi:DNA-binding NarL/FixJ family response regulator